MRVIWKFSILSGTAITAYLAGRFQAQKENVNESFKDGPGVPVFPKIYAATPLIEENKIKIASFSNLKEDQTQSVKFENESVPVTRVSQVSVISY